jgi:hypothetical protein
MNKKKDKMKKQRDKFREKKISRDHFCELTGITKDKNAYIELSQKTGNPFQSVLEHANKSIPECSTEGTRDRALDQLVRALVLMQNREI